MDWDKLRIFHAVAESGSLTAAGKNLGLSQSAVSRQIATLEQSLRVSLFRRHARGLVLTEQGIILHDATADIYSKLSLLQGQIMDTRRLPEGPLTITVSEFIATTWLAPRLAEFREKYPKIQLSVLIDDRILKLNMREADAAIRLYKPTETGLIQRRIASIRFQLCGAPSYFKKYGAPEKASELKNHCLLAFPEGAPAPFDNHNWILSAAGVTIRDHNNLLLMNSMYSIYAAARSGAGIAVLPAYLIDRENNLEAILPEAKRPNVEMYFIFAEERKNSRRINALRDFILDNVDQTPF